MCGFSAADPLPLTYPHILGFPLAARLMADPAFPLPLLGLVHTSIDIVQHAPLHAGDQPLFHRRVVRERAVTIDVILADIEQDADARIERRAQVDLIR